MKQLLSKAKIRFTKEPSANNNITLRRIYHLIKQQRNANYYNSKQWREYLAK